MPAPSPTRSGQETPEEPVSTKKPDSESTPVGNPTPFTVNGIGNEEPGPVSPDFDEDGIPDTVDNCPDFPNPGQEDVDQNGIGDRCLETDLIKFLIENGPETDGDGVPNIIDNCPFFFNPGQEDKDQDGIGDVCHIFELAENDLERRIESIAVVRTIGRETLEEVVWQDTCLGLNSPEPCIPKEIPGYRVIFRAVIDDGERYMQRFAYHTDKLETFRFVGSVE